MHPHLLTLTDCAGGDVGVRGERCAHENKIRLCSASFLHDELSLIIMLPPLFQ